MIPVVIVETDGVPVCPVDSDAPVMTVAANGLGLPITVTDEEHGAPFVVDGLPVEEPPA